MNLILLRTPIYYNRYFTILVHFIVVTVNKLKLREKVGRKHDFFFKTFILDTIFSNHNK